MAHADADRELVVELKGRLGNQLFIWASGYGIARRAGAQLRLWNRVPDDELLLPALIGSEYREVEPRHLWKFGAVDRPATLPWLAHRAARWYGAARRCVTRGSPVVVGMGVPGWYRAPMATVAPPALLRDWMQSERYFSDVAGEIDARIRFPETTPGLPGSLARPVVSVAFRRGDYNALGVALPLSYYSDALAALEARCGAPPGTLVLFSDDVAFTELAAEWFGRRGAAVLDAHAVATDPIAHLRMMSECDHFVTANSSFSWWGAWLGEQRRGGSAAVVAPLEYGTNGDRVPARWISIEAGIPADLV